MLKNVQIFIVAFVLGVISKDKLVKFIEPLKLPQDVNVINIKEISPTIDRSADMEFKPNIKNIHDFLLENNFTEALYIYRNSEDNRKEYYKNVIEAYISTLYEIDEIKSEKLILQFMEEEANHNLFSLLLKIFISQNRYKEAIALIVEERENYISDERDILLSSQIRELSQKYIEYLRERMLYSKLISFLKDMINLNIDNSFYNYTLLALFMDLNKLEEASIYIDILNNDEIYADKIKIFNKIIEEKQQLKENYKYKIPLQKSGKHYIVKVFINGVLFKLMLDTGASFIFIDENKIGDLNLRFIRDIRLQTASDLIVAKLCEVPIFRIGNMEIENIKVTTHHNPSKTHDGLLGMNFFKRFDFYIDQKESILYLNPNFNL